MTKFFWRRNHVNMEVPINLIIIIIIIIIIITTFVMK